jgi:hypothetical protein
MSIHLGVIFEGPEAHNDMYITAKRKPLQLYEQEIIKLKTIFCR